jgi:hypothetical protein
MALRSADLLSLGVALPPMIVFPPADAGAAVELVCGFEENKPSGAFTLTINR